MHTTDNTTSTAMADLKRREEFEQVFVTLHAAPAHMLFRRLVDDRRYEMLETEYAWLAYNAALARRAAQPAEGSAGQAGQVAMPDKAAFEVQAKYQGAANLMPAENAMCWNGWFPATYLDPATELAWRVWANKPSATERAAAPADQAAPKIKCLRDEAHDQNMQGPCSAGRCEWPNCYEPVKRRATHQPSAQDGCN